MEHESGFVECTDMACLSFGVERHSLVIDCGTVDGGCGCTEHFQPLAHVDSSAMASDVPQEQLLRAS